jgi:nucleoside 2-deoxyribosyltransferase
MSKTVYIAGKVFGLPEQQVREKIERVSTDLQNQGYRVVSPAESINKGETWERTMKQSIKSMLECDEVHLLPGWQESRGAQLERDIAIRLGMDVVYH